MPMTITRNNSFRFETNQPDGFRVCVFSSRSQDKHVITYDLWNGITNTIDHPTPTITEDASDFLSSVRPRRKAEVIHSDHPNHENALHYQKNPKIPHKHISYRNQEDMLSSFKADFPEQEKIMSDIQEKIVSNIQEKIVSDIKNLPASKKKFRNFLQRYLNCVKLK